MTATTVPRQVDAREGYRLWSRVYDEDRNPLLSLEQRYLECLLPPVENKDVLDLGCGTGRWLRHFAGQKPRTLVGIDSSPDMLEHAKRKLRTSAELRVQDCGQLVLASSSADLIVCSFLVSYIEDFKSLAKVICESLRPGGSAFLTDIHPGTMAKLGWRRGFKVDGMSIEIATFDRPLDEVVLILKETGFQVDAFVQPPFGEAELAQFEKAGKSEAWHEASRFPAIYILELSIPQTNKPRTANKSPAEKLRSVGSCRIALGAQESFRGGLRLDAGCVASLDDSRTSLSAVRGAEPGEVDLSGLLIFPGLINPHDHLEFALFPRLGKGGYRNFTEWAEDIHSRESSVVKDHRSVPRETRLRWGAIRNILCGVTTVCHHNPYDEAVFEDEFPVRVLKNFGWAHSVQLDASVAEKKRATAENQPFILHLGEGIDAESAEDIFRLEREFPLDSQTVLVHALGADENGRKLIRASGACLVWCPSSNVFLFGKTLGRDEIRSFPAVTLGSDSPLTAEGDLLDEIRFAREFSGISVEELYAMVTTKAAQVLRLREGEGTLRVGAPADFFAVIDRGLSPATTLAQISYRDVKLVVVNGVVQAASAEILHRLPPSLIRGMEPLRLEGELRWIRGPVRELFLEAQSHLPNEIKLGGREVQCEFSD